MFDKGRAGAGQAYAYSGHQAPVAVMQAEQFGQVVLHIGMVGAGKTGVNELPRFLAARLTWMFQGQMGKPIAVAADRQRKQAGAV